MTRYATCGGYSWGEDPSTAREDESPISEGDTDSMHTEQRAFAKIERLIKVRDRSVREVRNRLEQDGYPSCVIDTVLDRAIRCGFLDDARFADVLIRSRLRAGKGLMGIASELKRHNIDPEIDIEGFPEVYLSSDIDQKHAALALLERKPPHSKNKQQAAYAKLIRSGYSSSIASEAAREWYRMQGQRS